MDEFVWTINIRQTVLRVERILLTNTIANVVVRKFFIYYIFLLLSHLILF